MRIESPEITHNDGRHVLSAGVGFDSKGVQMPETLWFAVNDTDPRYVRGLADAFLVSLVAVAMKLGEDIRVEGEVSSCLAHGLMNYRHILSTWWPESFEVINIDYDCLVERREDQRPSGVACALSGREESLRAFTEWLPGHPANNAFEITHAMITNELDHAGDSPNQNHSEFVSGGLASGLAESAVELLLVHTNQDHFRRAVMSDEDRLGAQSSALAACAHAMSGTVGRLYIPGHGGYAYEELLPSGSHPALDHHLGSDQLQVVYVVSPRGGLEA